MNILGVIKHASPLAKKIVISVVLASTFITIFTSVFQLYEIYKVDVSGIKTRMNEVRDSYSKNIATRLWVFNKKELDETLKGVLRLPAFEYVEVYEDNDLVARQGVIPTTDTIEREFPLFYTFRNEEVKIGYVHLTASLSAVYTHIYDQAIAIIISNAIKTFFISGFMLYLFYVLVARHLISLGQFAERINVKSVENKLSLQRKTNIDNPDEIDTLANTLIGLQDRLRESLEELEDSHLVMANSEARFRGVIESSVDGILMVNDKGLITLVNNSLCKMTGYTIKELIGETVEKLVPSYYGKHQKLRENYIENPISRSMGRGQIFHTLRKDGSKFPVEISLTPVIIEQETFITAMVQDITARIKIENEREELLETLEHKNEELESFTYTVSHDLKSPLVTITGFIGLLKNDIAANNKDRIESDFTRISEAAETMQNLLNDLLELSRIGRKEVAFVDVEIKTIVNNVLEMLTSKIDSSKAKITIEPELPAVHVDEVRFKEVYLNLIDNAIKYSRDDVAPEISIGGEYDKEKNEVTLFVKDNGIGIAARYQKKIFGLFERLSNDNDGTGVGLAIVKRIVEVHNGKIWVESAGLGNGSVFKLVLPQKITTKTGDYDGK